MSRTTEIDGHAFCSGSKVLGLAAGVLGTQSRISSTAYLIQRPVLLPKRATSCPDRFSLHIASLGELLDMYHDRKATDLRDKVYALLGMSSDLPGGITPDYGRPWKEVFCHLVKSFVGEKASVTTGDVKEDEEEIAIIESKACVLGHVSEKPRDDRVGITWRRRFDARQDSLSLFFLPTGAKPVEVGDIVCLLQGASKPTIIRPCNGYWAIVKITVHPDDESQLPRVTAFPIDILLIWDWKTSQIRPQDGECYELLICSQYGPKCPMTECNCQDLGRAIRSWDIALLLIAAERYEEAGRNLIEAVSFYGTALGNNHGPWREADGDALKAMNLLLIEDQRAAIEAARTKDTSTPLFWAAQWGHEAVLQQLVEKGAIETRDKTYGRPLLLWAAENGHEAVVQLLLEEGATLETTDTSGQTPLSWAASMGYEAVVRLLLEKGATLETTDYYGRTPHSRAADIG